MIENATSHEFRASTFPGHTPRRVKVYLLQGDDWIDKGTGYCSGEFEKDTKKPYFLVRSEAVPSNIILKSYLEGSIQYQRQQETLIVWTDLLGKDLALSFQETEGCADLCEFIIQVQQEGLSASISLYFVVPSLSEGEDVTELITGPISYPEKIEIENIESVKEILNQGLSSQFTRTSITKYIIKTAYVDQITDLFNRSEKLHLAKVLYLLSDIVKTLILYNEVSIIEEFLKSEERVTGLVGILEYDSDCPSMKACFRELLQAKSFKMVIPVARLSIFERDFYLKFLKDTVMARVLDDQTFNFISSMIYVNQMEIIKYFSESDILDKLFQLYSTDNDYLKRDGVIMLHQYVLISKSLQSYQKLDFYSALIKHGLFSMIKFALEDSDGQIRVLGTELIVIIIEHDVSLLSSIDNEEPIDSSDPPNGPLINEENEREPPELKMKLSDDMSLILILTRLLLDDKRPGLKVQIFEALKSLLSSKVISQAHSPASDVDDSPKMDFHKPKNDEVSDINTSNYFKAFYDQVAPGLFKEIILLSTNVGVDSPQIKKDETLYKHLCDLIAFCCNEHDLNLTRSFFLGHGVLNGVCKLMASKYKRTLKLSSLRCLKSLILLDDEVFDGHIINNYLLDYFFEFFETIVSENSLANSSCLDFMETIIGNCEIQVSRRDNFKRLARHIYNHHKRFCETKLTYVSTGKKLIDLVENNFYESLSNGKSMNGDATFDSEDEPLSDNDTSTPKANTDADDNGDSFIYGSEDSESSSPRPVNLFEHIEKDMELPAAPTETSSGKICGRKLQAKDSTGSSERNYRKRISSNINKDMSNASEKVAPSLR